MEKWGYKTTMEEQDEDEGLSSAVLEPGPGVTLEEGKGHDGSCEEAHPDDPSKKGHEDYMAKQNKEE